MISFERIIINDQTFEEICKNCEANIFHTSAWFNFLVETQNAEPVIASIKSGETLLGYFIGFIVKKFGFRILGSPFRGTLAYFMGFNLVPGAPKREILRIFPRFAFNDLKCHYLELVDINLSPTDWEGLGYQVEDLEYYGIDLSKTESELFASMDSTGRNCIRKSIKNGVSIEEAHEIDFADQYYSQYTEVLAKRSMTPTYSLNSVRKLIEHLLPSGNLLLLRAKNIDGSCIATGIILGMNNTAVFWGAASWQQYQCLRPNEPIAWYGMKYMKARGIEIFHFGGKCKHYKEKLGAVELPVYRIMKAKYKLLEYLIFPLLSPKNDKYRNWILKRISN